MYFELSSTPAPSITRTFSSVMVNLSSEVISSPFFLHVTDGAGTPLTGHLMVMVVLEAAVTLSPMFIVIGLPSPTGISRPDSGTSIVGLIGSVDGITCLTFNLRYRFQDFQSVSAINPYHVSLKLITENSGELNVAYFKRLLPCFIFCRSPC